MMLKYSTTTLNTVLLYSTNIKVLCPMFGIHKYVVICNKKNVAMQLCFFFYFSLHGLTEFSQLICRRSALPSPVLELSGNHTSLPGYLPSLINLKMVQEDMFAIHIAGKPLIGPPQSLRSHFAFKDATHHTKEKYGLCVCVCVCVCLTVCVCLSVSVCLYVWYVMLYMYVCWIMKIHVDFCKCL